MSYQVNSLKKGLTVKDLVTTGIFSAIFFVFTLVGGLPFAPNPVLTFYMPMGAALLCADGSVYAGCNIENAGFTATCCAERTAFFRAVNDGKRQFKAIAIVGGRKGQEPRELCAPCGVCRQVMAEFCGPEFEIVMTDGKELQVKKLEDLMPLAFGPGNLQ